MSRFHPDESLGSQTSAEIKEYLELIGDEARAHAISAQGSTGQGIWGNAAIWAGTDAIYGFIEEGSQAVLPIVPLASVQPDGSIAGKRVKVTLDRFYVEEFPGFGTHRILCEFSGKNQVAGKTEELNFVATCNARDGQSAGVSGLPVFMGLTVGRNGINLEGRTVNVSSESDDIILGVLDGDAFKKGLELIQTAQPAIKPLASLAEGLVRMVMSRRKNRQIHTFSLGLDFAGSPTSARLRYGSFVVMQVGRKGNWDWSLYGWNRSTQQIVPQNGAEPIGQNYMVFGISPFVEDDAVAERA
ncbi:hypothetical protein [Bosea massiliensis]|uniref:Uncharacterized protein n=1 Tax=Bosea massiliensis TaxID=151419 RepID=A0ABW0P3Y3_9HYPH